METDNNVEASHTPLFESDDAGQVTHVRGLALPPGVIHMVAGGSVSDRSPGRDTAWVIRGAYRFARRVQGSPEKGG